jgi:hypothetical protein
MARFAGACHWPSSADGPFGVEKVTNFRDMHNSFPQSRTGSAAFGKK